MKYKYALIKKTPILPLNFDEKTSQEYRQKGKDNISFGMQKKRGISTGTPSNVLKYSIKRRNPLQKSKKWYIHHTTADHKQTEIDGKRTIYFGELTV